MTWMDDQLRADLQNGFIDGSLPAGALGPEILTNRQGNTIFNEIKNELRTCTNFKMAVAFKDGSCLYYTGRFSANQVDYDGPGAKRSWR